jgi:hypothetical protein
VFDADKMRRLWLAACLLNVRLALRSVNVPIAHGRNVVAGLQCSASITIYAVTLMIAILFCHFS